MVLTIQVVHRHYHGRVRSGPAWDCGFPMQTPRMQDTAEGFGQPIRQVFEAVLPDRAHAALAVRRHSRTTGSRVDDHFWHWLYLPVARGADVAGALVGRIQQGRISVYLIYSFCTLLALLFFVR